MTGVHRAEPKELKLWHSIPPTMAHLNPFFNTSLCTKEPSSKAWFWRWWSAAWPLASNCDIYSHWQYLTIPHSTGLLQRTTARCNLCHRFFAPMIGLYVTTLLVEIDVVSGDFGAGDTLTLDGAPPSSCPPNISLAVNLIFHFLYWKIWYTCKAGRRMRLVLCWYHFTFRNCRRQDRV